MPSVHLLPPKAVSAPGKVLLAGGYLVLDSDYTGLVFGLNARIHVYVEPIRTNTGVTLSEIIVKSPQFSEATWEYGYRLTENDGGIDVTQLRADSTVKLNRNPFVETALAFALSYISQYVPIIHPSSISILADNDYYSTSAASSTSRFHNFNVPLTEAHKTGLGSSAALVTSFTGALLTYYLPSSVFDISSSKGLKILHNLAQAAHCAAQGKVGSGFDVASAVYGSNLYRRFSPSLLSSHGEPGSASFATKLKALVEEAPGHEWDTQMTKSAVEIPRGLRLVMCDVDCGSQTPGMVKQVLSWRKENPEEANKIWADLQTWNEGLAQELVRVAKEGTGNYTKLTNAIHKIRGLIKQMSEASGVPIEPKEQTQLLDACEKVDGVIGGVVPGAGGYDAVVLLIEDKPEVIENLKNLLDRWKVDGGEDPKAVTIGKVSMLGVREDMIGVQVEDASLYSKWIQ